MVNVTNLMQNLTSLKIKNIAFNEVIHSGNDLGDHIKMAMEDNRDLEIFLEENNECCTASLINPISHNGVGGFNYSILVNDKVTKVLDFS